MSEKELKTKVDEYFEKYMCVSFEKFLENWEEQQEFTKYLREENETLKNQFNKVIENLQQPYLLDCEQQCKDCLEILGIKYDG